VVDVTSIVKAWCILRLRGKQDDAIVAILEGEAAAGG
jgi:hypothetical protein